MIQPDDGYMFRSKLAISKTQQVQGKRPPATWMIGPYLYKNCLRIMVFLVKNLTLSIPGNISPIKKREDTQFL